MKLLPIINKTNSKIIGVNARANKENIVKFVLNLNIFMLD